MTMCWERTSRCIPIYDEKNLDYTTFTCTTMTEPKCFWYAIAQAMGYTQLNDFIQSTKVYIDGDTIRSVHAEVNSRLNINIISILISWNQLTRVWEHYISNDCVRELIGFVSTVPTQASFIVTLHIFDPRHVEPRHVELLVPGLFLEPPSKTIFSETEPLVQHILALGHQINCPVPIDATLCCSRQLSHPTAVYRMIPITRE